MRTDGNLGGRVNYEPNRFGDFAQDANVNEPPLAAGAVDRYDHREDDDYYSQPGTLFRLFDDAQRERFFGNIARPYHGVPNEIVARQIEHFRRADPAYAEGVIAAMADSRNADRKSKQQSTQLKSCSRAGRICDPLSNDHELEGERS